jgi:hypothetical protein
VQFSVACGVSVVELCLGGSKTSAAAVWLAENPEVKLKLSAQSLTTKYRVVF